MGKAYIIAIFVAAFMACSENYNREMYKSLAKADSLLMKENPDSALKELTTIGRPDDNDRKCKAYYGLLVTQARYLLNMNADSTANIDYAIKYYEKTNDKEKLARALHWKAGLLREAEKYLEAIEAEKGAEANVNADKSPMLAMRIYDTMSWLNDQTGNYPLAKEYAFKQLKQAERLKDKERIADAHYQIANIYTQLEKTDSALYHIEKSILLIDHVKTLKQSILHYAALCYRNTGQWEKAEEYIRKGMKIIPETDRDALLGDIYIHTGRANEGVAILQKVLPELEGTDKWVAMQLIEDVMMKQGRYAEAARLQEEITLMKDSLTKEKKMAEALEVQKKYDKRAAEAKSDETPGKGSLWIVAEVVFLTAIIASCILYVFSQRKKQKKYSHEIDKAKRKITEFEDRISRLNEEKEKNKNEIDYLNEKMGKEKKKIAQAIARGKELYEKIAQQETPQRVIYNTGDYADFVEYYRTIEPAFMSRIEKTYKNPTPYGLSILILQKQYKFDDKDTCIICGILPNALRVQKLRMNKRIEEEEKSNSEDKDISPS